MPVFYKRARRLQQALRRVQRGRWSGLAQPGVRRSSGRSESGYHGEQWRQAHGEPDEEAGYELDYTWGTPNGQGDPAEWER